MLRFPVLGDVSHGGPLLELLLEFLVESVLDGEVDGVSEARLTAGGGDGGFEVVGFGAAGVAILVGGPGAFADHFGLCLSWLKVYMRRRRRRKKNG